MIHSERIHKYHNAHFVNVGSCDWGRKLIPDSSDGGSRQASTDCIVTIAMDSYMKLWKFDDVAGVLKLENSKEAMTIGFLSVALSPDASVAATSTYDSMLMLWDTTTGELKKKFDYQLLEIWTIAFLPNSNHIITGSNDGKVKKICLDTGAVVQTWNTGGAFVTIVVCSPDGKHMACGKVSGFIHMYNMMTNDLVYTLKGNNRAIRSLRFSPDSKFLLIGSNDGDVILYDTDHSQMVDVFASCHYSTVESIDIAPNCRTFISGGADKTVKLWDISTRVCMNIFEEHTDQVTGVKYNPAGDKFLSISEDQSIVVYSQY